MDAEKTDDGQEGPREPTLREAAELLAIRTFGPEKGRRGYLIRSLLHSYRRRLRQRAAPVVVYPASRWRGLRGPTVSKAEAKRLAYPRRQLRPHGRR